MEWTIKGATKLYLFHKRKRESIDKTPKRMTNIMVVSTKSGFGSRLREGKVLTPLAFVLLKGNRLVIMRVSVFLEMLGFSSY